MSLRCWNPQRWLLAGDSRIAAFPAETDSAICAKVKSMNRFTCSTRAASRPSRVRRPLTSFSARNGLGAAWWPGIATSRAPLRVEQSTAQIAASHECTWIATPRWTSGFDKSWRAFSSQSTGSTCQPTMTMRRPRARSLRRTCPGRMAACPLSGESCGDAYLADPCASLAAVHWTGFASLAAVLLLACPPKLHSRFLTSAPPGPGCLTYGPLPRGCHHRPCRSGSWRCSGDCIHSPWQWTCSCRC